MTAVEEAKVAVPCDMPIVLTYDDVSCIDLSSHLPERVTPALWYRIIPVPHQERLAIYYKGPFVGGILSERCFSESYLFQATEPPKFLPQNCFQLPASDLSLDQAMKRPIRLRQAGLDIPARGLIIAFLRFVPVAIQAYPLQGNSECEIYKRIDNDFASKPITWKYVHLLDDEKVAEVIICSKANERFPEPRLMVCDRSHRYIAFDLIQ